MVWKRQWIKRQMQILCLLSLDMKPTKIMFTVKTNYPVLWWHINNLKDAGLVILREYNGSSDRNKGPIPKKIPVVTDLGRELAQALIKSGAVTA